MAGEEASQRVALSAWWVCGAREPVRGEANSATARRGAPAAMVERAHALSRSLLLSLSLSRFPAHRTLSLSPRMTYLMPRGSSLKPP